MIEENTSTELTPEQEQMKAQILRETDRNIKNLMKYPGRVRKIKRLQKQIHNLLVHIRDQDHWNQYLLQRYVEHDMAKNKGPHIIYAPMKNHISIKKAIGFGIAAFVIGIIIGIVI